MADIALSSRTTTTTIAGGYVYITIPDAGSPTMFSDRRISITALLALIQSDVDTNTSDIAALALLVADASNLMYKDFKEDKTTNFTVTAPAGSVIKSFNIRRVGSYPTISIGTTSGGDELISERTLTKTFISNQSLYSERDTTIYISVSDGQIDLSTIMQLNLFTNI